MSGKEKPIDKSGTGNSNSGDNSADRIKEQQTTYEIYAEMPDDGLRYEIFDGMLEAMSPGPGATHQDVCRELVHLLRRGCISDYKLYFAPLDVILDQLNVMQPDIMMIHRSRLSIVTKRGIEGAPDLVVEILSPGSGSRDKVRKRQVYERFGVAEYWIVDPVARTLDQYSLVEGAYGAPRRTQEGETVVSDRLTCLSFSFEAIFKDVF